MKRWVKLFKALANLSRLEIIRFLANEKECSVTQIAARIHVLMAGTSRHLSILEGVGIVESVGKNSHVYYYLNPKMPTDAHRAIKQIFD